MSSFITHSFQMANGLVDHWLPRLSGSALKVYLAVVRKTRGWQKQVDLISVSQFERMTGLSRPTVRTALDELLGAGLICTDRTGRINAYWLNDQVVQGEEVSLSFASPMSVVEADMALGGGNFFAGDGKKTYHKVGKSFAPQKDIKTNLRKKGVASDLSLKRDLKTEGQRQGRCVGKQIAAGQRTSLGGERIASVGGAGHGATRSAVISAVSVAAKAGLATVKTPGKRWCIANAAVPEGVSAAVWRQYLAVRHGGRNRLDTEHKYLNLLNKLSHLRAAGQDVNRCLDQSQQESWLGVFAVKPEYVASGFVEEVAAMRETAVVAPRMQMAPAAPAVQVLDRVEAARRCQAMLRQLGVRGAGIVTS